METTYGNLQEFWLGKEAYQIQSVDRDYNTSFIIRKDGEYLCTISMNEEQWTASAELSEQHLTEILWVIKTLYE